MTGSTDATPEAVRSALADVADPARAAGSVRFFKTGPGGYAEGDVFLGVTMPQVREVARRYADLPLAGAGELLSSAVHEVRLCALVILVSRFERAGRPRMRDHAVRARVATFYLDAVRRGRVDNWDLVDASADRILGAWLADPPTGTDAPPASVGAAPTMRDLDALVAADDLWQRRVAIIATYAFLKRGDGGPTLRLAPRLLEDPHDLIHKATGWMLRELGERVGRAPLEQFLEEHAARMPRTMLSYATEHLAPEDRARFRAMR
ncbi:DNA alkylation repair protein [Agromyces sp. SYSU T0242]|uniref:DNA alkylation repair protein n=1 Tax=Agromyces litoreus TaxID=3158561 RepID=UPI0033982365